MKKKLKNGGAGIVETSVSLISIVSFTSEKTTLLCIKLVVLADVRSGVRIRLCGGGGVVCVKVRERERECTQTHKRRTKNENNPVEPEVTRPSSTAVAI